MGTTDGADVERRQGIRAGNWLSQRQAQALLSAPDVATVRGLRRIPREPEK